MNNTAKVLLFNDKYNIMEKFTKNTQENLLLDHKYGEYTPPLEQMPIYNEKMIQDFKLFFLKNNYSELQPVPITSGIDSTVRFVGSHISPMKEFFLNDKIPENGLIMSQPCVRTRNQPKLFDDSFIPEWGSFFKSLGVLVKHEKAKELCTQSLEYLLNVVKIPPENLVLRINNDDSDLTNLALEYSNLGINYDNTSMPEKYYRHKFGVDGVFGKNFNYAIKKDGVLYDIGNFISIENNEKQLGVELALGTSTILKNFFSLEHVNSANPVIGIEGIDNPLKHKFEDTIITSAMLMSEGLRPSGSGDANKERLLRSYLRALIYFKNKFNLKNEDIVLMMKNFETMQGINNQGSIFISEYITKTEEDIINKKQVSPEEEQILLSINNKKI